VRDGALSGPAAELIDGILPAIAIDRAKPVNNARSTVGR